MHDSYNRLMRRTWAVLLSSLLILLVSCSKKPAGKRYELNGDVMAVDSAAHQITVAHEDIPGLMGSMTMPFLVASKDDWVFGKIEPGDKIHATLVLSDHAQLEDINFTRQAPDTSDGTSQVRLPKPGDQVPDFALVNQMGKKVHLAQFHGKPVLLTFIYTRCPLPDFCPLMSSNFSQILKDLHQQPEVFSKAQLLSISIDPEHDTPAVLKAYGERYVDNIDPSFQHWTFATGTTDQVRQAANYFGLAYNGKTGQIVHNLSTVLVGADGKVVKVYVGNQWKPEEVAAEYAKLAGS
jgi:protein SCO1